MKFAELLKLLSESSHAAHGVEFLIENWPTVLLLLISFIGTLFALSFPFGILSVPTKSSKRFRNDFSYVLTASVTTLGFSVLAPYPFALIIALLPFCIFNFNLLEFVGHTAFTWIMIILVEIYSLFLSYYSGVYVATRVRAFKYQWVLTTVAMMILLGQIWVRFILGNPPQTVAMKAFDYFDWLATCVCCVFGARSVSLKGVEGGTVASNAIPTVEDRKTV